MTTKKSSASKQTASKRTTSSRSSSTKSRGTSRRKSPETSSTLSQTTIDHDQIRRWAEERGAHPACVKGTGGKQDVGMIRLDFPGYTGEKLQEISWDEFFEKFDDNGLALVYQDHTASGETSNFNKLVSRDTAGSKTKAKPKTRAAG